MIVISHFHIYMFIHVGPETRCACKYYNSQPLPHATKSEPESWRVVCQVQLGRCQGRQSRWSPRTRLQDRARAQIARLSPRPLLCLYRRTLLFFTRRGRRPREALWRVSPHPPTNIPSCRSHRSRQARHAPTVIQDVLRRPRRQRRPVQAHRDPETQPHDALRGRVSRAHRDAGGAWWAWGCQA